MFLQCRTKFLAHDTCAMNICWMNTWKIEAMITWLQNETDGEVGRSSGHLQPVCPWVMKLPVCVAHLGNLPEQVDSQTPPPWTLTHTSRAVARTPHMECPLQLMQCRCLRTVLEKWGYEVMSCMENQPKITASASVKWCKRGDQIQLAALETHSKP